MPLVVCLNSNIYDEDGEKRFRGDAFEASQEFADMVLTGDEKANRPARLSIIKTEEPKKKPGRPKKVDNDDED